MEFRDLKKQYSVLGSDIDRAMREVAAGCRFISGPQVGELERELAGYVGVRHCVSCANGTDALSIAMMVWGIGPGDAVFVPDFTFFSSGEIVSHCGAVPVFVDVSERSFNMCADSLGTAIERTISKGELRPRAIVAVDLFGLPADYRKIRELADRYGLLLLEDGAQGFGGMLDGRRACSFGDISTTSFFPAKPLGCYGDGGAIFTDNDAWAELARSITVHGKGSMKYDNVRIGLNSRLDTLQAAILQVKFAAFRKYELDDVNRAAAFYDEAFAAEAGLRDRVALPEIPEGFLSSWAQYTIRLNDNESRSRLQKELKARGIPSMVYYPKPMHRQLAFGLPEDYEYKCPHTEILCDTVLSLPMHPYLSRDEAAAVVKAIAGILA